MFGKLLRLMLEPGSPNGLGGGGGSPVQSSQVAPQSSTPATSGETPSPVSSLDRTSIASPATNLGERTIDTGTGNTDAGVSSNRSLPTPADPNQAAGTASPANFQSIRDAAREYGYNFGPEVADDRQALNLLIQQANANRQADYYAQVGQRLAPHAQAIQSYLAQQSNPQPQGRKSYEAPPFDPKWLSLVSQDPATGMYISKPGADPKFGQMVDEYANWKQEYDRDPAKVLNSMVADRAREVALEIYQQQSAAQRQTQAAQQIMDRNADWFWQKDAAGRVQYGQNGQGVPTPMGADYIRHLTTVKGMGVNDPSHQDYLTRSLMAAEYSAKARNQASQPTQGSNFSTQQAMAQTNTNPLQALPPQQRDVTAGATRPDEQGLDLMTRLRRDLAAAGVDDAAIAASFLN